MIRNKKIALVIGFGFTIFVFVMAFDITAIIWQVNLWAKIPSFLANSISNFKFDFESLLKTAVCISTNFSFNKDTTFGRFNKFSAKPGPQRAT